MNEILHTKFGTARISNDGYYQIISRREGNRGKLLHRLIFEDYHNCKLDKNDVIHHLDFDKKNNHYTNLVCMSRKAHSILHKKNKTLSEETKQKMSEYWDSEEGQSQKQKMSESIKEYWDSEEGQNQKQKMSESRKNKYATIKKAGFTKNGKQNYALKFEGKVLKESINPNKLLEDFLTNYPLEIIKIPEWLKEE